MQTAQDLIFVSTYTSLEEAAFTIMTSLKDRLEALSLRPIENEADARSLATDLATLSSDTQALSNSLTEGTSSDINLGHLRNGLCFEKGIGSAAA